MQESGSTSRRAVESRLFVLRKTCVCWLYLDFSGRVFLVYPVSCNRKITQLTT